MADEMSHEDYVRLANALDVIEHYQRRFATRSICHWCCKRVEGVSVDILCMTVDEQRRRNIDKFYFDNGGTDKIGRGNVRKNNP